MRPQLLLTLVAASLLAADPPQKDGAKEAEDTSESSYVKVEIKGTLQLNSREKPEKEWKKVVQVRGSAGLRIIAPGDRDALSSPFGDGPLQLERDRNRTRVGDPGIVWELFLGDNEEWHQLAKGLDGKSVIVKGKLTIISELLRGPGSGPPPPPPRIVVRVTSFEAVKEK
jgi:hypothetical protein